MIYIETFEANVGASVVDYEIGHILVSEGYTVSILELGFTLPADSWVYCYIGEVLIVKYHGSYKLVDLKRILTEIKLVAGQKFKITSTSITGGQTTILVIFDKST